MEQVFQWIKKNGGVEEMEKRSLQKCTLLYNAIKNSNGYYSCPVDENVRSRMNVPFRVGGKDGNDDLETKFIKEAEKRSMYQLKGHRYAFLELQKFQINVDPFLKCFTH